MVNLSTVATESMILSLGKIKVAKVKEEEEEEQEQKWSIVLS
jgi:hypothetical protein